VFEDDVWIIDVGVIYTTDEDEYGPMVEDVPNTFHQGWRNKVMTSDHDVDLFFTMMSGHWLQLLLGDWRTEIGRVL
jgi:hypothetical protein